MTGSLKTSQVPEPTPEALLNMAREYHDAAEILYSAGKQLESPLYYLYTHTIELAFKAYLRSLESGVPRTHDLRSLRDQCARTGLKIQRDLGDVVDLLSSENEVHGFRYFAFVSTGKPAINYLRPVVDALMIDVSQEVGKRSSKRPGSGIVIKYTVGKEQKQT